MEQIHATCVAMDGIGLLLRGVSGSGKSDLALRLIDGGAELVADDRVDLQVGAGHLMAAPPQALQGLLEVRGLGILHIPWRQSVAVRAFIDLVQSDPIDRLPETRYETVMGISLPCFLLNPQTPSATAKVGLVRGLVSGSITRADD